MKGSYLKCTILKNEMIRCLFSLVWTLWLTWWLRVSADPEITLSSSHTRSIQIALNRDWAIKWWNCCWTISKLRTAICKVSSSYVASDVFWGFVATPLYTFQVRSFVKHLETRSLYAKCILCALWMTHFVGGNSSLLGLSPPCWICSIANGNHCWGLTPILLKIATCIRDICSW